MTKIWKADTESGYVEAGVDNFELLDESGLVTNLCRPMPHTPLTPKIHIMSRNTPGDFFTASTMCIVSRGIREIFESFSANVEYLEVEAMWKGQAYTGKTYYYANILDAVQCMDYSSSIYTQTDHGITGIEHLVIDEAVARQHSVFMLGPMPKKGLKRGIRGIVRCVSDTLAERVEGSGVVGVRFVDPWDL